MSETPTPTAPDDPTAPQSDVTGSYAIITGTNNRPTSCSVSNYSYPPEMCANSDAIAKEEKRKSDHAHNLRLQKARRHGGKMKPW